MKKNRIYAILNKPVGRGNDRRWEAFSFNPEANQNDVEDFMIQIHVSTHNYFLIMESKLDKGGSFNGFYYCGNVYPSSETDGKLWVNDTPVNVLVMKTKRIFKI